ncbi:MAG: sulfatase-like hydrolase/transferase [Planctomycetota bacterium]
MSRPNILFFMLDQVSAEVLRPDSPCRTPNLDRILQRGLRVDRAYTPNPICTPARASLQTGLWPHNHGALHVHLPPTSPPDVAMLRSDKRHWAQQLEAAGYRTGHWGKWHVDYWHNVNRYGWQQWDPAESMHTPTFDRVWTVGQPSPNPGYSGGGTGLTATPLEQRGQWRHYLRAKGFLEEALSGGRPWACMMSFSGPHSSKDAHIDLVEDYLAMDLPLPASRYHDLADRPEIYRLSQKPWQGMTDEDHRKWRACYYAAVEEHDRMFGLLLDQVEAAGQLDDTIIVFTTDHGDALGAHGVYTKILFAHEPVYNIPLAICGPGIAADTVSRARVGLQDLAPTLCSLTGVEQLPEVDGRDASALFAEPAAHEDDWQVGHAENYGSQLLFTQRLIWEGDWKLVYNGFGTSELYDLGTDPDELHNRIDDPAADARLRRLAAALWRHCRDTGDTEFLSTPPCFRFFPYGPGIMDEEPVAG